MWDSGPVRLTGSGRHAFPRIEASEAPKHLELIALSIGANDCVRAHVEHEPEAGSWAATTNSLLAGSASTVIVYGIYGGGKQRVCIEWQVAGQALVQLRLLAAPSP